jgi:hypothetical protein
MTTQVSSQSWAATCTASQGAAKGGGLRSVWVVERLLEVLLPEGPL